MKVTNEELQILVQKGAVVYDERQRKYFEPGSTREVEILNTEPKITVDRQEIGELATGTVTLENMDLEPTAFEARLRIAEALIGSVWLEKVTGLNDSVIANSLCELTNHIVEGIDETCWEYEDEGDDTPTS